MNLSVTSRNIDVSPALVQRTEARLEELFSKYFGDAISANVTFGREGQEFKSRLEAHVGSSIHMDATATHADAYAALDSAAQNLAKRLRRHKRKIRGHHHTAHEEAQIAQAQANATSTTPVDEPASDLYFGLDQAEQSLVIAEDSRDFRTMTVAEAVDFLDDTEGPALLFMNSKTGRSNMIYRRNDGNIGWVEPKDRMN